MKGLSVLHFLTLMAPEALLQELHTYPRDNTRCTLLFYFYFVPVSACLYCTAQTNWDFITHVASFSPALTGTTFVLLFILVLKS